MATLQSEGVLPRKAAATALKKFAVTKTKKMDKKVNRLLAPLAKSDKVEIASLAGEIKLETEYWH